MRRWTKALAIAATAVTAVVATVTTAQAAGFTPSLTTCVIGSEAACTAAPWMQGVRLDEPVKTLHPNVSGHKQYADLLRSVTG
ncbi:hypothetical protein [Paractinoplanes deccanensis]|nr:hypothetical protein [Actinoplanes deccanensis]